MTINLEFKNYLLETTYFILFFGSIIIKLVIISKSIKLIHDLGSAKLNLQELSSQRRSLLPSSLYHMRFIKDVSVSYSVIRYNSFDTFMAEISSGGIEIS